MYKYNCLLLLALHNIAKVYTHELVHLFANTNFENIVPVLSEGMAIY